MQAEVRSGHCRVHSFTHRGGLRGRGRPPALLGNSLGLIGAWLVSHVSTYWKRRRIPLPGLWEQLYAHFISITTEKCIQQAGLTWQHDWAVWSGVFQCKEVRYCTLPLYVVFCWRISDLVKSLSAHFVPGISFLYSACNLLLLFCHNPFRVMKPPLLLYRVLCSPSHAHKPQPYKKENGEWVHCRFMHVFSVLHWEMREVNTSTDGEKQKLPCCCCFTTTHSLTFFLSFFFFFFSCCGNAPFVSHQPRSPHWPCSVRLKKSH